MTQALFYSSTAVAMTLAAGIGSGDVSCTLSTATGLPASFPFKLLIGWSTGQQEVVHCTALAGAVATIVRGQDGTTAQSHSIGASVVHGVSAREFNDLELHVGATGAVHGLSGNIVGTTDTQTLSGKTLTAPIISTISNTGTLTLPTSTDTLVGRATTDTLTNKTLTSPVLATPTVTGAFTGPSWGVTSGGVLTASNYTSDIQTYSPVWAGSYLIGNSTTSGYWVRLSNHLIWFYAELIAGSTWSGNITNVTLPTSISPSSALGHWHRWSGNNNNIGGTFFGVGGSNTVTFRELTSSTNNLDQTIGLSNTDHMIVTGHYYSA